MAVGKKHEQHNRLPLLTTQVPGSFTCLGCQSPDLYLPPVTNEKEVTHVEDSTATNAGSKDPTQRP
ncbi:hypothetical protein F2Q70_00035597 [Brassica cretica]|uniref:Uncharacterized protein n=2 Tax=Brassica cretica TaxID=69181 RepID=A0A3N6SIN8_BRACR|nr:hypothetical protein F2Q70_00035597 [Brassica cretica]KAF3532351.1 hypothetical protein DY000_02039413 [Brassica cretica]KAF3601678.1 hypothetical protein F2Q69_00034854 [Brassica cretica]